MSNKDWTMVRNNIREWYNLNPTIRQFKKLIGKNKELVMDIASHGNAIRYLSTSTREEIADEIALKIANMSWPIGADKRSYCKKFYNKMYRNAKKMKIDCDFNYERANYNAK